MVTNTRSFSYSKDFSFPENPKDGQKILYRVYNKVLIELIWVAPGSFVMGDKRILNVFPTSVCCGEIERPVKITNGFYISRFPVTQAIYKAILRSSPSYFKDNLNNPVEGVSWFDANNFALTIGARLPTEAEWEWAARGGCKSKGFDFCGSNDVNEVSWYRENSEYSTQPVGSLLGNELGIHDMCGNVWEWVSDKWNKFDSTEVSDPKCDIGTHNVVRGGSWHSGKDIVRVNIRNKIAPTMAWANGGFRVVFDVPC